MKNREAVTYTIVPGNPDDHNFQEDSEYNLPFRMHTHASNGEELDFKLCHPNFHVGPLGSSSNYIVHNGKIVAKIYFEPGPNTKGEVTFSNTELFNMDDLEIAMLKCAEGIAQRVQHWRPRNEQ